MEVGRSTAKARTKETALGQLGQLAGLRFNSDTMWQQRLQGQQKTIRLLVLSRPRLTTDWDGGRLHDKAPEGFLPARLRMRALRGGGCREHDACAEEGDLRRWRGPGPLEGAKRRDRFAPRLNQVTPALQQVLLHTVLPGVSCVTSETFFKPSECLSPYAPMVMRDGITATVAATSPRCEVSPPFPASRDVWK